MRLFPLAVAVLAGLAGAASAQPKAAPKPTFDEEVGALLARPGGLTADAAAKRAVSASPSVMRRQAETAEARSGLTSVKYALVPITTLSAGYTRLSAIEVPELAPGFSFPVFLDSYHVGAEVAIPLTDLILRLPSLKKSTEHGIAAAESGEKTAELGAAVEARVAYYEWVRSELATIVAARLLEQVQANLGQVRALAEVSRVSRADVLRLEAQEAQVELGLAQVRELSTLRAEQLRIAIGAAPDEALTIGEDVRDVSANGDVPSAVELTKTALGHRGEVVALREARAALEQHKKADQVDRLPKLSVFAQGVYDNPNQRIFPSEDKFNFTWAAGARLTWSLNDYLNASPHDAKADAQLRALDADRQSLELGVRAQVTAARQAVVLADHAYEATRRGLAAAEESHRVRQELLAAERATAIELIDADTELTRARIAAIDALIDRRIARARLANVIGEDQ
ncbi:MAG TPA: TolC family protein [Kofleriaceae bacterium]|nr:TolC family protein [Kofleriaceae bacterium]